MPDFSLSAKVVVTQADVSKLQAALNQLKNIKTPVDSKAMQDTAMQTKALAAATATAQKQTGALVNQYKQMRNAQKQLTTAKNNVKKLGTSTKRAAGNTRDLSERMKEIGPRALAFRVATVMINGFVNAISEALTFLRELDQILADIQKISGQSAAQLAAMGGQLIDTASVFGLAAQEVAEQFKTIVQAGFEAGRAMEVVENAAMGAAATTLSFAQATEILIQTIKVFGEQDAASLFDKIAIAESSAAVTAKDVQDAMKRSAATFDAVNASVSDMIGLISSLQETSRRGGAVVGTAFRTINTRIVAGDTRKAVEKLGIVVADSTGKIRPLIDILGDLSTKFQTLTQDQQVQAATTIAGRRQFESFMQIINNVDRAQEISIKTTEAQGEAMRRAAIQAETINGVLNKLNNAFLKTVTAANSFIPVTEVLKDVAGLLADVLNAADGAVGKFAALAGGILLMKGAVKVIAPLLASMRTGGLGLLGGGKAGKGKIGVGGAAGILAVSAGMSVLSGTLSKTETDLGHLTKSVADAGTAFIGFAFGPIAGIITALTSSIPKITTAISSAMGRQEAYAKSMEEFGNKTLADTQAALVDARAAGDNYTVSLLEQSAKYSEVVSRLNTDSELASKAVLRIADRIAKFRKSNALKAPSKTEVREMVVGGLQSAGIDKQSAESIALSETNLKKLLETSDELSRVVDGETVTSLDGLVEVMGLLSERSRAAGASVEFVGEMMTNILSDQKMLKTQNDLIRVLEKASLANYIFINGITDAIEIRKLQAKQEVDFANKNIQNQREMFAKSIQDFSRGAAGRGTNLDIAEVQKLFAELSKGGHELPKVSDAIERLGSMAAIAGADGSEALEKAIQKLVTEFLALETTLVKGRSATREFKEAQRDMDFDALAKSLNEVESARKMEQDRIKEMTAFMGQAGKLANPISQARRELIDTIAAENRHVQALEDDRQAINEQIAAYEKQLPSQKKDAALKELNTTLSEKATAIEVAKAKATFEAAKASHNLAEVRKKAIKKTTDAQKELISSLEELAAATSEAITQADVDAQQELKEAQQSVIESAENLSDAYSDLRDAQLSLGDSVAEYTLGLLSADREIDMITGNIRGFTEQFKSIQNVFDEVLATTAMTEQKRLELLQESANQQLALVENVISETISIGQRIFTMDAAGGAELTRGFAALRDVISSFQAGGGFEGMDLNAFGNTLLALPQSIRQEMASALSALPSTATLGGMSKEEIERILFGSAVGESEEANIQNINDLTETQVELMGQIAELNQAGILSSNAQLAEAQKQVALAEEQLALDEIMLDRADENVQIVREEINTAAMLLNATQNEIGNLTSASIDTAKKENIAKRATEHAARLAALQQISSNTETLTTNIGAFMTALGTITGAARGHIPKNFAGGNMREVAGVLRAYHAEKRAAPGANPVIANDSEWIIPTKNRGNVPNHQAGNAGKIDVNAIEMERLLTNILEEIQAQNQEVEGGAVSGAVPTTNTEPLQATININAEQNVKVTGAATVADAVANSIKNALGDTLNEDQLAMISEQMLEIFDVLKNRGLMNSLGGGL